MPLVKKKKKERDPCQLQERNDENPNTGHDREENKRARREKVRK